MPIFHWFCSLALPANGLRYLRWGGDGEAVQPEKGSGVEKCLGCAQNPQRQVHALLGARLVRGSFAIAQSAEHGLVHAIKFVAIFFVQTITHHNSS